MKICALGNEEVYDYIHCYPWPKKPSARKNVTARARCPVCLDLGLAYAMPQRSAQLTEQAGGYGWHA